MFEPWGIFETTPFSQEITPLTFPPLPPFLSSSTPLIGLGIPPLPSINQVAQAAQAAQATLQA